MKNLTYTPNNKDLTIENLDEHIDINDENIKIVSNRNFVIRLWYMISNPLCYLFNGYVRY